MVLVDRLSVLTDKDTLLVFGLLLAIGRVLVVGLKNGVLYFIQKVVVILLGVGQVFVGRPSFGPVLEVDWLMFEVHGFFLLAERAGLGAVVIVEGATGKGLVDFYGRVGVGRAFFND